MRAKSTEKPILFSGPMVRAILEGRKTQTRRAVPSSRVYEMNACIRHYPYGRAGDRLWVRETWAETTNVERLSNWPDRPHIPGERSDDGYLFDAVIWRADGEWAWCDGDGFDTEKSYLKPSIHMPRTACRLLLDVKAIRVERLQDISENDAIAEGVDAISLADVPRQATWGPRPDFAQLWDSINEKRGFGWATNPWVWIIEFERE